MPTIPLPQTPQVQRAAYGGARPADRSAEFQGQMALGAGLTAAGDAAQRFALASQQAKNAGDLAKSELAMRKAKTDIALQMEATANPDEWEEIAQRGMEAAQTALFEGTEDQPAPAMAPAVRRQVEAQWGAFRQDTLTNVTFQAARARNKDADLALTEAANVAYMDGNAERGDEINSQRVAAGLITEAQGKVAMRQGRQAADKQNALMMIDQDPNRALEFLEDKTEGGKHRWFKELSIEDRRSLKVVARREAAALREQTTQGLLERRMAGEVISRSELDTLVEQKLIAPQNARNVIAEQVRTGDDPEINERFRVIRQQALRYDPSQDPTGELHERIFSSTLGLAPTMRERVLSDLNRSANPSAASSGQFMSVANSFFQQRWAQGSYGETTKIGSEFLDEKSAQHATTTMMGMLDEMDQWLKKNPGATRVEVLEKAQMIDDAFNQGGLINRLAEGTIVTQGGRRYRFKGGDPGDPASYDQLP